MAAMKASAVIGPIEGTLIAALLPGRESQAESFSLSAGGLYYTILYDVIALQTS
jgi:hypothetical protein